MFHASFPPELLEELAVRWNRSGSEFLICYHGPKYMVDKYHFSVELMVQSTAYMTTSSEGHECYIYRRIQGAKGDGTHCDKFFSHAWDMCRAGDVHALHKHVIQEIETLKLVDPRKRTKPQLFTIQWTKRQVAKKKKPAPKKTAWKNPGTKKKQKWI